MWSGSGEGLFPGYRWLPARRVLTWPFLGVCVRRREAGEGESGREGMVFLFFYSHRCLHEDPALKTSSTLITPQRPHSQMHYIGGLGALTCEFRENTSIQVVPLAKG